VDDGHGPGKGPDPRAVVKDMDTFQDLVAEALDSLPDEFREALDNVEVVVAAEPAPADLRRLPPGHTLFGLYQGIPQTKRGLWYQSLPDKITIFMGPIVRASRTRNGIRDQVRRTVMHEIGHHFGIDDERLHELGY
jgi:predicted Zn-dependent protease with MMP-like domain